MFAVVQIGSKARKSPCITARSVFPAAGVPCALRIPGAPASAAAAAVVCRKLRRVLIMVLPGIGAVAGLERLRHGKGRSGKRVTLRHVIPGRRQRQRPEEKAPRGTTRGRDAAFPLRRTATASGTPQTAFANSRSLNFCTLPVDVFGSSMKTTCLGIL